MSNKGAFTVSDLTRVESIRQAMPAVTSRLYLNTGTFGPLPQCAVQIMQQQMQQEWLEGRLGAQTFDKMSEIYQNARQAVARLLQADEGEIALTDNTGEGLNIISYGFNWQAGDEIITTNHEHLSLLAPLYQLRDRYGIVIRFADLGPHAERSAAQAVAGLVTQRTRLITLSHVTWTTGSRLDIEEVGRLGRAHGIPVLVDGAQSAGAIPLAVHDLDVDFYAIPGQKWLCGPDGTGALYARYESLRYTTSSYVGYWSTEDGHASEWKLWENARRFEVGGRQTAAVAAQAAALTWLAETIGYQWLFARIAELHTYAFQQLQTVPGLHLFTPRPGMSGLLTFTLAGQNPEEVMMYLRDTHNIYIRTIPELNALRASTGFYNTEEEIATLTKALTTYQETH